jgi:predicted 2-oxoglutarate/Fe(II)-dependent dioxygenase YbiX
MKIEAIVDNKVMYITECIDREHLDQILEGASKANNKTDFPHFYRTGFSAVQDKPLVKYINSNIKDALSEFLNLSNLDISDYISYDRYFVSTWKLNKSLAPHRDTVKYDESYTQTPRSSINSLVYLTDDYDGGEIIFPELGIGIKPEAGSIVIFHSDILHGVNEVTRGERLTLESNLYDINKDDIEEMKSLGWREL